MRKRKFENDEERNYRSRYDSERHTYRKDRTTYVYQEWIDEGHGCGHYLDHVIRLSDAGVTLELLDFLQQADNAETQDREDAKRFENLNIHAEMEKADGDGWGNLCSPFMGSPEFLGPEAVIFAEKNQESRLLEQFKEEILPELTESQVELIRDLFGEGKTLQQVAIEISEKKGGKPITHQAVSNRLKKIKTKIKKKLIIN